MDSKFSDYYKSLGMGKLLIKKMSALHDQINSIMGDQPQDVVISEYVTEDGERQYTTVLLFTNKFVYEIENFISDSPKIWIAKLVKNIAYIALTPKDYNLMNVTKASRLNLECRWPQGLNFILDIKTSGDNCKHLLEILNKYIKPNLV